MGMDVMVLLSVPGPPRRLIGRGSSGRTRARSSRIRRVRGAAAQIGAAGGSGVGITNGVLLGSIRVDTLVAAGTLVGAGWVTRGTLQLATSRHRINRQRRRRMKTSKALA